MRPKRTSVALWTEGKLRVFTEVEMEGIINSRAHGCSLPLLTYAGVTRKLMSTAVNDRVSAATDMKSTPASA